MIAEREGIRLKVWWRAEDRLIDTGLVGDVVGDAFIVPFNDHATAEEVARVVTGTARRGGAAFGEPED